MPFIESHPTHRKQYRLFPYSSQVQAINIHWGYLRTTVSKYIHKDKRPKEFVSALIRTGHKDALNEDILWKLRTTRTGSGSWFNEQLSQNEVVSHSVTETLMLLQKGACTDRVHTMDWQHSYMTVCTCVPQVYKGSSRVGQNEIPLIAKHFTSLNDSMLNFLQIIHPLVPETNRYYHQYFDALAEGMCYCLTLACTNYKL
jgi:hypothetical protein